MRQTHATEQAVLGGGLEWTKESPARSKKGLIAAVAILAVGGLAGGAYVFTQRSHSEQPAQDITAAERVAPSAPVQPPPTHAEEAQPAAPADFAAQPAAEANSNPVPASEEKPADVSRPVRHEQVLTDLVKPASAPIQSVKQTVPLRPAVQVGKLKAPILKNAAISGSSEPPPAFSGQLGTRDVLGAGGLSGTVGPSAPAPPVAFSSPEVPVKTGGQIQMPKVISSPPPAFPDLARSQGVQGTVVMDALIDATGTVAAVKVISGPLTLRQAAMDALRRWKYQPARLNGQPTSVHISVNINFTRQ
jgi:protein TonB